MNLLPSAPGSYVDISVYKPDLEYFLEKFRNNEHFAFARYQDQWWASVARALQQCQNYKPHVVSEAFSKHYHNTNYKITSDVSLENFWLLSQSRPVFVIGVKCMEKKFSKHIPKLTQDTEFLYAHCWRQISRRGDIVKMFEEFKNENFIVIGPHYLKNLGSKLDLESFHHIEISGTAACEHFSKTVYQALELYLEINDPGKKMFILSVGGYFGNAVVNRLYQYIDDAFIIEMGRALDAFYCHDKSFRDLPKFWWSLQWFERKDDMRAWTDWVKPFQSHE